MISVVIPTLNAAPRLGPTLGALSPAVTEGSLAEVIFADGGSSDDTEDIADLTGARFVAAPKGRGPQLRAGAAAARGRWLLFLHDDTVLSPDWLAAARAHMAARPGKAGWFRLRFDSEGPAPRLVAGWANFRARALGLPFGDQGLLVEAGLYAGVGGYPATPLMEDVALARALGRRRLAPLAATATTSAARYEADGWTRRGAGNLWRQARYLAGASPESLARDY